MNSMSPTSPTSPTSPIIPSSVDLSLDMNVKTWELNLNESQAGYHKTNQNISPLWRLAYMYSIYQLILVMGLMLFPKVYPTWFADYVRATSVFVALGWIGIYIRVGMKNIYNMYASIYPGISQPVFLIADICTHFVPLLLIGFPHEPKSYFIAAFFVMVWYQSVRNMMPTIYNLLPISEYDIIFYMLCPMLTIALYIISKYVGA